MGANKDFTTPKPHMKHGISRSLMFLIYANLLALSIFFYKDKRGNLNCCQSCNVLLHLVMVPSNHIHGRLLRIVLTTHGPLVQFVSASYYVIVSTFPIVI